MEYQEQLSGISMSFMEYQEARWNPTKLFNTKGLYRLARSSMEYREARRTRWYQGDCMEYQEACT